MNYSIIPLEDRHYSQAIDVLVNSFTVDGYTPDQYSIQRVRKRIIANFDDGFNAPRFLVAVDNNNNVIGVAGSQKMDFASKTWTMFLLAVAASHRGNGVGTDLVHTRLNIIYDQMNGMGGRVLVSSKHRKRFERLGFKSVDYDEQLGLHLLCLHVDPRDK